MIDINTRFTTFYILLLQSALLLAWQNYWMLIGWEEYNYFINCTSTINDFPKTNKMAERYFKHKRDKREMKLPWRN
jgi:hypothetical protein